MQIKMPKHKSRSEMGLLNALQGASKKKTTILGKGMKAKTIRQGGKGNRDDDDDSSDDDDW